MAELVLVGGYPASGKTTVTQRFVDKGYHRLNRDLVGGKVDDLLPMAKALLVAGNNVVMDNLYATKQSRAGAINLCKKLSANDQQEVPIRFVLMGTSLEESQFNACLRMMQKAGKILSPEDHKKAPYKDDPNLFPVAVLYKYRKEFEKPTVAEGFSRVDTEKFLRIYPKEWVNKALILDFDGTIRTHVGDQKFPVHPSEVRAMVERTPRIKEYLDQGYILLGASNQSGIAKELVTEENCQACFDETAKQMGLEFEEVMYCPHQVPPITCMCRKPGSGMGVELIYKYNLDPRKSIYVGDMTTDKSFASRCGFKFVHEQEFFKVRE